jgi:PAS domain S-box-containing protein
MTLAITRDEAVAFGPWREAVWGAVARTAVLSLLVALTTIGMLLQLRRLDRGEQALRRSEERYAMAMEAVNGGHAEWNVAQDTVFASDAWLSLHGVDGKRCVSSADVLQHVVLHPDDLPLVKAAIEEHLAGCSPAIELEYRVRLASGEWRWIHARARCLGEQGADRPRRLFSSAIDVTERKEVEAAKADLEGRRQQARRLEALGTLAGGIAHDFNNILGAILGFGQMAQQQAEPGSRMRRHLDRVMQAGARARLLVRQILEFSRSGVTEREPVSLQAVVEEVLAMLKPSLPSGLRLETRLEAGGAAVMGDSTQLFQVVMNVCTNAMQSVGEYGRMAIGLRRVDLAEPRVLLQGELQPGPHLRLEVADSGGGMPPDVLARIFEPFFTTKKVGEGTGLGLSVVPRDRRRPRRRDRRRDPAARGHGRIDLDAGER